jgi:hypothetical protein
VPAGGRVECFSISFSVGALAQRLTMSWFKKLRPEGIDCAIAQGWLPQCFIGDCHRRALVCRGKLPRKRDPQRSRCGAIELIQHSVDLSRRPLATSWRADPTRIEVSHNLAERRGAKGLQVSNDRCGPS